MKFRLIPPGRFQWPPRSKSIVTFSDACYMGVTEVTAGEFSAVLDLAVADDTRQLPRTNVSALEAIDFCERLSANEALMPGYRLAACAESEFAALGGRVSDWRPTVEECGSIGWFIENSGNEVQTVAGKSPSSFGIFDLYGNVWELGDSKGGFRGIAFTNPAPSDYGPLLFVSNQRYWNGPEYRARDVGFRVAMTLTPDMLKSETSGKSPFDDNRANRPDATPLPPVPVLRRAVEAFRVRDKDLLTKVVAEGRQTTPSDTVLARKLEHLLASFEPQKLQRINDVPQNAVVIQLSKLVMDEETLGWGPHLRDQLPLEGPFFAPFLEVGGTFFESGMFAHSPSHFALKLEGGWKSFSTKFGLQDGGQGSVVFVVKGDGRELFRSPIILSGKVHEQTVDVTGVKKLELLTEVSTDGHNHDWSIWLDPQLHRPSSR